MSPPDSHYAEIVRRTFVYINLYVVPVLYVTSMLGNLVSAVIFFKRSWRKNVCVFYFLLCLLTNSCYVNSGMLSGVFTFGLNINLINSSVVLCKLLYYVAYVFSAFLPTILILASIDRLFISSKNVDMRLYSSKRLAYFSVSIGTSFWIVFYIHVLIKIRIQEIYPSVFFCYYETSGFYYDFIFYSNALINMLLSLGIIIVSAMTFKNVQRIRAVPRQQRHRLRTMNRKDFQLLRCLYVHDIVYIIFITFPSVYGVYEAVTKDEAVTPLHRALKDFFFNFGTFIHHIPYCFSFFIFISVSKAFRQEVKRLACQILGKDPIPVREEENAKANDERNNVKLDVVVSTIEPPARLDS